MKAYDLNIDKGFDILIDKADDALKDENVEDNYSIYLKFKNLKKQPGTSIKDYILEFESLKNEISLHNMLLPDPAQDFKILEGAIITDNQRQMTLTFPSD